MTRPATAIVFWYYKDLDVCVNRVEALRRCNPDVLICGLFGGDIGDYPRFDQSLRPLLDDNWCYPQPRDPRWKWKYGDKILVTWFLQHGRDLP